MSSKQRTNEKYATSKESRLEVSEKDDAVMKLKRKTRENWKCGDMYFVERVCS